MPRKSWWARLPFGVRMAAGTSALLILIGGGAAGVATLTRDDEKPRIVTAMGQEAVAAAPPAGPVPREIRPQHPAGRPHMAAPEPKTAAKADTPAPRTAKMNGAPLVPAPSAAPAQPVQTTRTEIETREIPFETQLVRDPKMARGTKRVETPGVPGEETLRYLVTLTNGRPTERKLLDATVTKQPQHRVVAYGSKRARGDCGDTLNFCVPLGRSQFCPQHMGMPRETSTEDVGLLDPDDLLTSAGWGRLGECR